MNIKNESVVYLSGKVWEYSKGNRHNLILYIFLFICANAINFLYPLIIGKLLNVIQESGITNASMGTITIYLLIMVSLTASFWAFHGPARVIELKNAFIVKINYKKYLLDGTMALPADWHTTHHSGDTIDKVNKGAEAIYRFSSSSYEVIETVLRYIGSYIVLAYFNLPSSYIVLFATIIAVTTILRFDKYLIKKYKELNKLDNDISAKVFDVISNITTVIILRIEKLLSKAIFKKLIAPLNFYVRTHKISETKWFLVSMINAFMTVLVLYTYIHANLGNQILLGTVYILYGYVDRINGIFFRFAYKYGEIVRQRTDVANAEEISNEFRKKKKVKQIVLGHNWKELKIENLNFSYCTEEGSEEHLKNININIKRGEKIAFIGESGSGKTTTMKVLRDLYHPKNISLYLNGILLKDGFSAISDSISLIPQEPEIFESTIKENITLGQNIDMNKIKKYTNMAEFTNVVQRLPKKFESSIHEKGVNLSGGEKQRLALSRGLIASEDKAIVLLDEPTSSVDTKNELKIYQNIFQNFKDKTIIASVHRLHMLSLFNRIYFFSKSEIITSGTFDSLLRNSKEFMDVWRKYQKTKESEKS